jgi:hypothetical protein
VNALAPVENAAEAQIAQGAPYTIAVGVEGTAPFLFHRWSVESIAAKASARKGSKQKKSDDVESYVYRDTNGDLCIPGEYLRQSLIAAAKFLQDPRSPRKSAADLFKAGIVVQTELASLNQKSWDYLDQRRVMVQRNGITRQRPAISSGWRVSFDITVLVPEYISRELLHEALMLAGRLVGMGDFRPTYGRFAVCKFETAS